MTTPVNIHFDFNARYYKTGEINENTKQIWFVLHGYGQLAQYFSRHFSTLHHEQNCIIAPEGLSRFYLQGFDNRVGATWMTKEDRLTDIENYLQYLNSIYQKEVLSVRNNAKITLLGFSQGAATVSRWAQCEAINFDRLILWAGLFPPDLDIPKASSKMKDKEVYFVYGKEDPYINPERIKEQEDHALSLGVTSEFITFEGKHEIDSGVLERFR